MTTIPQDPESMVDFEVPRPLQPVVVIGNYNAVPIAESALVNFKSDGTIYPDYRGWRHWRVEMGRIIAYAPGGGGEQLSSHTVVSAYKKALSDKIGREMLKEPTC